MARRKKRPATEGSGFDVIVRLHLGYLKYFAVIGETTTAKTTKIIPVLLPTSNSSASNPTNGKAKIPIRSVKANARTKLAKMIFIMLLPLNTFSRFSG